MRASNYSTLTWSYDEETEIGTITLDRPNALNALSEQMITDLIDAFAEFESVDERVDGVAVRVVILQAAGEKAFCVGGDIKEIRERGSDAFPGASGMGNTLMETIERFPAPVVAKIDGYCLGGGFEIALACDFRFASEQSEFGLPEVNLGIFPGSSGTQRLSLLVGPNRAKEILMTGDRYEAQEFADEQILNDVVPKDQLDDRVDQFAEILTDRAPLAIRAIKDVVNVSNEVGLTQGARHVTQAYLPLLETKDHERAIETAFSDEEPDWEGK